MIILWWCKVAAKVFRLLASLTFEASVLISSCVLAPVLLCAGVAAVTTLIRTARCLDKAYSQTCSFHRSGALCTSGKVDGLQLLLVSTTLGLSCWSHISTTLVERSAFVARTSPSLALRVAACFCGDSSHSAICVAVMTVLASPNQEYQTPRCSHPSFSSAPPSPSRLRLLSTRPTQQCHDTTSSATMMKCMGSFLCAIA